MANYGLRKMYSFDTSKLQKELLKTGHQQSFGELAKRAGLGESILSQSFSKKMISCNTALRIYETYKIRPDDYILEDCSDLLEISGLDSKEAAGLSTNETGTKCESDFSDIDCLLLTIASEICSYLEKGE